MEEDKAPINRAGDDDLADKLFPPKNKMDEKKRKARKLYIAFAVYLFYAAGNRMFSKLQAVPMNNYPLFLNLLLSFFYIPVCLIYSVYMVYFGDKITPEMRAVPWYKFFIMGLFDAIAGAMQTFGFTYINSGGLIVLLTQFAIPISMVFSILFLKEKYKWHHYIGSLLVIVGLIVAVIPTFQVASTCQTTQKIARICPDMPSNVCDDIGNKTMCLRVMGNVTDSHNKVVPTYGPTDHPDYNVCKWGKPPNPWYWIIVMALSCIPMALSNVYKEKALNDVDLDVMYMNGWVSFWQFIISLPFTIGMSKLANVDPTPKDISNNLWQGMKCWFGINSHASNTEKFCKDNCPIYGPLYVSVYFVFNLAYNIFIILLLKYGGATLYFVGSVLTVPLVNTAFALPFIPAIARQALTWYNEVALAIIIIGLIIYRFWNYIAKLLGLTPPATQKELESSAEHAILIPKGDEEEEGESYGTGLLGRSPARAPVSISPRIARFMGKKRHKRREGQQ